MIPLLSSHAGRVLPRLAGSRVSLAILGSLLVGTISSISFAAAPMPQQTSQQGFYHLDPSFGQGGIVRSADKTSLSTDNSKYERPELIVNNNVLYATGINTTVQVKRYAPDGSLDQTFGSNGIASATVGTNPAAIAMATQSNGSIIVLGANSTTQFLVRFTAAGQLDTTFGTNGIVNIADNSQSIVIQPDDAILLGGNSKSSYKLARYTAKGALDQTFSSQGSYISQYYGDFVAMTVLPSGQIVAIGYHYYCYRQCDSDFTLWRFSANGTLDTTIGDVGITTFSGFNAKPIKVMVDTQGRYVVALDGPASSLLRLTTAGTRDSTFGINGVVSFAPPFSQRDREYTQLSDGSYLAAINSPMNVTSDGISQGTKITVVRVSSAGVITASGTALNTDMLSLGAIATDKDGHALVSGANLSSAGAAGSVEQVVQIRFVEAQQASQLFLPIMQ